MTDSEREDLLRFTIDLARHVGRDILMPRLRLGRVPEGLEKKGARDLVTDADREAEAAIVAALRERCPDHAIVAEESVRDDAPPESYRWFVDPLDGTTNFVHGLPLFTVSIACYGPDGGEVGVVFAPYLDEMFFAARGAGAHLNAEAIALRTSATSALMDATLATGFHYVTERYPNLDLFCRMLPRTRALRRFGSASLDLAYVAAGRFDGMWETGLNPFDIAAGCLLIQEAGGRVTDYRGGGDWLEGRSLLATNGALHEVLRREVAEARPGDPFGLERG